MGKGQMLIPPHEHCWHSYTSQVVRPGKNVHRSILSYEEFLDTGEKEAKKK